MKKISFLFSLSIVALTVIAQNPHNLVPNPSFEEVEKRDKVKSGGQIGLAYPWEAVTLNPVDLYSANAKNDKFSVPENKYGEEKARTGSNYAGVSFFGYRGRSPRTYLGVQLTNELIAGKEYCLKFHVSMSDMSKYAVNNIGMYIAKEIVNEQTDGILSFTPQILSVTNNVYDKQFLWEDVCGTYLAQGGEKYIVIGNFASDVNTKQEKVRLSRDFSGRQMDDAYYYIDDISVIATEKISAKDCSCDAIAGGKMQVQNKSFKGIEKASTPQKSSKIQVINSDGSKAGVLDTKKAAELLKETGKDESFSIDATAIYYDSKSAKPAATEQGKLDKVVEYLKANPNVNIEIIGHFDPSEKDVNLLGKRRAALVKKALADAGISDTRIAYSSMGSKQVESDSDPAMNRRVTFNLK